MSELEDQLAKRLQAVMDDDGEPGTFLTDLLAAATKRESAVRAAGKKLAEELESMTNRSSTERHHEVCHYHDHLEQCSTCDALSEWYALQPDADNHPTQTIPNPGEAKND